MNSFKRISSIVALLSMLLILGTAAVTLGAEEVITGKVESVTQATTKNGNPYTRVLVSFDRNLQGTDYSVILPVMGFRDQAAPAAELQQGDTLKAIAQSQMYQGRESFTIIRLLD